MNYFARIEKDEGILEVRLYSVPKWEKWTGGSRQAHQMMRQHWAFISERKQTEVEMKITFEHFPDESFGDIAGALENELLAGKVEWQNFKLQIEPDPAFIGLTETIRDLDKEIWLEIALVSRVTPPAPVPHKISEPRKRRLLYWGRAIRPDAKGHVDKQDFTTPLLKNPNAELHIGDFTIDFRHWFNVVCARKAEPFLDSFRSSFAATGPHKVQISSLLDKLVEWITPCPLIAIADQRLVSDAFISGATALQLPFTINGDTMKATNLFDLSVIIKETASLWGALFYKDAAGDHGPNSLYTKWKTIGEAIVQLTREFHFKFQVELPTLEEIKHLPLAGIDNISTNRTANWTACARWLFTPIDLNELEIAVGEMTVLEDTIDYTPSALYVNKITIKEPDIKSTGVAFPPPNIEITDLDPEENDGGQEISYTTLFSFMRKGRDFNGNLIDLPGGIAMYVGIDPITEPARSVTYTAPDGSIYNGGGTGMTPWALFHYVMQRLLWGGTRALLEFEFEGTGIMPFGTDKNFELLDWGDFPMLRKLNASPGILYGKTVTMPRSELKPIVGEFAVIEMGRLPGGNGKLRAIERRTLVINSLPSGPGDPPNYPPPDNPRDDPPTITIGSPVTGATISGTVSITGTITNTNKIPFEQIEIWAGGAFLGVATRLTETTYTFSWDTTGYLDGEYTLQAKIYRGVDIWTASTAKTVTIDNVAPVTYQATPGNPAGTTSTTGVMMGLGAAIAPLKTGKILILISGTIKNNTADNGAKVQIRYGTGTAPINSAALTGTTAGGLVQSNDTGATPISPFALNAIVSGLTLGTTYWIDVGLAAITGGTATITDLSISIMEIA